MNMVEPKFTPAQIEKLIGVSPITLRGWRYRELITGFGLEQDNGRWLYSGHEVLTMAIGRELEKAGADLKYAFWMGWTISSDVLDVLMGQGSSQSRLPIAFWTVHAGSPKILREGWELQWLRADSIDELRNIEATSMYVLDAVSLAKQVPSALKSYVLGKSAE